MTNVKLQGLEDRWFRGLTKIIYQLFFSVFIDIFYIMVFLSINGGGGGGKTQIDDCHNKMVIIFEGFP